ncbi:hypothetical protein BJ508DRAFT_379460 [Ascobolus immersus RN42]|uniref:Uncharacterized protein n=1 Tax=Ascobolus immersus RN42 TaxID=1160509 RepID=A0A3N4HTU3_ASCIM|nr:hypothetical protein BJ508DRAFT_379460 [Ascobolus immersus RN42]
MDMKMFMSTRGWESGAADYEECETRVSFCRKLMVGFLASTSALDSIDISWLHPDNISREIAESMPPLYLSQFQQFQSAARYRKKKHVDCTAYRAIDGLKRLDCFLNILIYLVEIIRAHIPPDLRRKAAKVRFGCHWERQAQETVWMLNLIPKSQSRHPALLYLSSIGLLHLIRYATEYIIYGNGWNHMGDLACDHFEKRISSGLAGEGQLSLVNLCLGRIMEEIRGFLLLWDDTDDKTEHHWAERLSNLTHTNWFLYNIKDDRLQATFTAVYEAKCGFLMRFLVHLRSESVESRILRHLANPTTSEGLPLDQKDI